MFICFSLKSRDARDETMYLYLSFCHSPREKMAVSGMASLFVVLVGSFAIEQTPQETLISSELCSCKNMSWANKGM